MVLTECLITTLNAQNAQPAVLLTSEPTSFQALCQLAQLLNCFWCLHLCSYIRMVPMFGEVLYHTMGENHLQKSLQSLHKLGLGTGCRFFPFWSDSPILRTTFFLFLSCLCLSLLLPSPTAVPFRLSFGRKTSCDSFFCVLLLPIIWSWLPQLLVQDADLEKPSIFSRR